MPLAFHDAPLTPSAFGEAMYHRGRDLVSRVGLRLDALVWDADEILWDWVMSGGLLLAKMPLLFVGHLGHREWVAFRPGMLELLWGMRHASLELGLDPHLRIWTSGYPWRLWKILREVEGFEALLGPPFSPADVDSIRAHPRVFTRPDYVAIVTELLHDKARIERLSSMSEAARTAILRQLDERPDDSGFKIPELALLAGRDGFRTSQILIDDVPRNVAWFHAAGRSALHIESMTPRVVFGLIPNSVWGPRRFLGSHTSRVVSAMADALETLAKSPSPKVARIAVSHHVESPQAKEGPQPQRIIELDIPSEILWREWMNPMRELRRVFKASKRR
jgi:hypothetical protein